jgi:hypothetical protein
MPFGPGDTIRNAVERLLSTNGAFVIFDDGNENEYVQYSLEKEGLSLFWPAAGPRVASTDPGVAALLESHGFKKGKDVKQMAAGTYVIESDGVYAQFGRDVDLVENFTTAAFEKVFGRLGLTKLNSRVES